MPTNTAKKRTRMSWRMAATTILKYKANRKAAFNCSCSDMRASGMNLVKFSAFKKKSLGSLYQICSTLFGLELIAFVLSPLN